MSFDDADDEDAPGFRPPPHPDDRLWRHPSEVGEHLARSPRDPALPGRRVRARRTRSRVWGVALTAGATGAALGIGIASLVTSGGGPGAETAAPAGQATVPAALADHVSPAVVSLESAAQHVRGSGVVVRGDGIVLTSARLLGDADAVEVRMADGSTVDALVVGTDPVTGIGVLDLPGQGHATAALAASSDVTIGNDAFSIAAREDGGTAAATAGVIGGGRRYLNGPGAPLEGVVEIEGAAAPGALGGPVVDDHGAVLGVTTAIDDGEAAASYITPAEISRKVADDLLVLGVARHGWLGIEGLDAADVPPRSAGAFAGTGDNDGEPPRPHGAVVSSVDDGSPAQLVGLHPGDVIVELDGQEILGIADLVMWLRSRSPGDTAQIVVLRHGEQMTLTVTLGEQPAG